MKSHMQVIKPSQIARLRTLPKAEIHVHLEGTFSPDLLEKWATEAKVPMPRPKARLFEFEGLADFLGFLDWACHLAGTKQRLSELCYDFAQRLQQDGTGYADIIVNPTHWTAWKGRLPEMINAMDEGFGRAEAEGLPPVGICISLLRTQSEQEATDLVELLAKLVHPRVVALSVDGNEAAAGRTAPKFAAAFKLAHEKGLKTTVHAGESSDADGVWDAIEVLRADRIDHGVRAINDLAVVKLLVNSQIPIGICPSSNIVLKVYPTLADHPIERLRQAGVRISINTDDPSLLGASLPNEYALCQNQFGWHDDVIKEIARTSIEASFAPAPLKMQLLTQLKAW